MSVSTVSTSNDTLTSPLPELSVSGGQLTIEQGSTIGDLGNADVVGLVQTGGINCFQNGESANQMSYLAGGWNGANQTSINQQHGTIQVDQEFLDIQGNSIFGGTLAGTGTIVFDANTTYTFTKGAKLTVNQLTLGSSTTAPTVKLKTNLTYAGIFNDLDFERRQSRRQQDADADRHRKRPGRRARPAAGP